MNVALKRSCRRVPALLGLSVLTTLAAADGALGSPREIQPTLVISAPPDPNPSLTHPDQILFARTPAFDEDGDRALFANINSNVAYIYKKQADGWQYQARLAFPGYTHGVGAHLNRDIALVLGQKDENGNSTLATLVFQRTNGKWSLIQTIPEGAGGATYASNDEVIAIARPDTHSVSFYTRSPTGLHLQTVVEGAPDEFFGASIALDRRTLVVAAPFADHFHGLVYVYQRHGTTWQLKQELAPSDPQPLFGTLLAVKGGIIVVGDYYADEDQTAPVPTVKGAAYIFTKQNGVWHQEQKLLNPSNGSFGTTLAVTDGRRVFVDAHYIRPSDDASLAFTFAKVFEYRRKHGEWVNTDVLVPPTPSNQFALSASLARCQFLTSDATVSTPDPVFDGEAYVYEQGSCDDD